MRVRAEGRRVRVRRGRRRGRSIVAVVGWWRVGVL